MGKKAQFQDEEFKLSHFVANGQCFGTYDLICTVRTMHSEETLELQSSLGQTGLGFSLYTLIVHKVLDFKDNK